MLITPHYAAINAGLHRKSDGYGAGGYKWAVPVALAAMILDAKTILDYGCGKGTLRRKLKGVRCYDPAIKGFDGPPEPADLVVSTDMLEHVEPECLDDVLDHIKSLSLKGAFLIVANRESNKRLIDGRNAHLIVKPQAWWMERFEKRWAATLLPARRADETIVLAR